MTIVWSTEARKSLRSIRKFIGQDSPFYATQMAGRIIERVELVAAMPERGHRVHEYPEALLREVHESPYRIIYACSDEVLHVITIVHFKQRLGLTPKKARCWTR